jgi:hypothetical protein
VSVLEFHSAIARFGGVVAVAGCGFLRSVELDDRFVESNGSVNARAVAGTAG